MITKQSVIGFIGTGVMGKSMARNLQKEGFPLHVYTRTKEKAAELIEHGAVSKIPFRNWRHRLMSLLQWSVILKMWKKYILARQVY